MDGSEERVAEPLEEKVTRCLFPKNIIKLKGGALIE